MFQKKSNYKTFFYTTIKEWNIFYSDTRTLKVLKFIQPKANSFFHCLNPTGIKLIASVRLGLNKSFTRS